MAVQNVRLYFNKLKLNEWIDEMKKKKIIKLFWLYEMYYISTGSDRDVMFSYAFEGFSYNNYYAR